MRGWAWHKAKGTLEPVTEGVFRQLETHVARVPTATIVEIELREGPLLSWKLGTS